MLADSYQGKRLNAPNDVVVKSDGSVWFTDPGYGILHNYEGGVAESELPTNVYRLDPLSGRLDAVITDFAKPNGLCFSPRRVTPLCQRHGHQPRPGRQCPHPGVRG